jgi:hypothetical protein
MAPLQGWRAKTSFPIEPGYALREDVDYAFLYRAENHLVAVFTRNASPTEITKAIKEDQERMKQND